MLTKVLLAALICASVLSAAPFQCATNTLDQYLMPFTCVGADMVQYGAFTFSSNVSISPTTIQVTPVADGFIFSSPFFFAQGSDSEFFRLAFVAYDPPIVDWGVISFDPFQDTLGPGQASIGTSWVNSHGMAFNFDLNYDSTHSVTSNSAIIGPAASVQIVNMISLQANGGSAGFENFEERIIPLTSPEPETIALSVIGMAAIAIFRRRQTT